MIELEEGQVWERDKSRRVIQEITTETSCHPNGGVIYALYREHKCWSNQKGYYFEWWYCRQVWSKTETFERWAKQAKCVAET